MRTSQTHVDKTTSASERNTRKEKLTVTKEPTQTNTADGFTEALQIAKFLELQNRLSMGYDNGDDGETSKREALAETGVCIATLMQQEFTTRRHRWNEWNWLSKA